MENTAKTPEEKLAELLPRLPAAEFLMAFCAISLISKGMSVDEGFTIAKRRAVTWRE